MRLITYLNFAAIGLFLKKLKPHGTVIHTNIPYLENEIYIVPLVKQDHSDKEIMKIAAFKKIGNNFAFPYVLCIFY